MKRLTWKKPSAFMVRLQENQRRNMHLQRLPRQILGAGGGVK